MNDLQPLRNLRPYGTTNPEAPQACQVALIEAIEAEQPSASARIRAGGPARSRRILLAAAACVLLLVCVPLVLDQRNGSTPATSADAVEFSLVADRVEREPTAFELATGEFLAERSKIFVAASFGKEYANREAPLDEPQWIQTEEFESRSWMTSRGELQYEFTPEEFPVEFPTPQDRANWIAAGQPGYVIGAPGANASSGDKDRPFALGNEILSYAQLRDLPQSQNELRAAIEELSFTEMAEPARTMYIVQNLLNYPISTQTRSTLFRILANTPGIQHRSDLTDALGRTADAIEWNDGPYRNELLYNPATGMDLEHRQFIAEANAAPRPNAYRNGMLTMRRTIISRGVVDSRGEIPR